LKETHKNNLENQGYNWVKVSQMLENTPVSDCEGKYPGYAGLWCKLIMAVTSYGMMKNTVAVIHGPTNCAWAVRNFCLTNYSLYYGNPFLHMPSTDIDQNDVISGGTNKLIRTLKEVDRDYKSEHICVFDTCSTALIGDDIETAIKTAQKDCIAKIDYISGAGFTAPALGKSIEETALRYAEMMEPPAEIIPDTVNILGQYKEQKRCKKSKYPDDGSELERLIEGIGLKVHRVLISGNYDYVKTAPQASVNIISCPTWGIPLAKKMQEKFKTPYINQAIPIGIDPTRKWLSELAKFTGKNPDAFIEKEVQELMPMFEKAKSLVQGKVALMECGRNSQTAFARPMAMARALEELGMEVRLFGLHPMELKAKTMDAEYFINEGFDPLILNGVYPYQQPINIKDLGFKEGEYLYFTQDVFPAPGDGSRVETSVHLRRTKGAPGRGVGFRGTKALYESIIEAVIMAENKVHPTLYDRVHGRG